MRFHPYGRHNSHLTDPFNKETEEREVKSLFEPVFCGSGDMGPRVINVN